MTLEQFGAAQRSGEAGALTSLVHSCARRFRLAAWLVGIDGPVVRKIFDAEFAGSLDLSLLGPVWTTICFRYREERFSAQATLFADHDETALMQWSQFVYHELFPGLLRESEFVRNVLRTTELLPCDSREEAARALSHHVSEMCLPSDKPLWDPSEIC